MKYTFHKGTSSANYCVYLTQSSRKPVGDGEGGGSRVDVRLGTLLLPSLGFGVAMLEA